MLFGLLQDVPVIIQTRVQIILLGVLTRRGNHNKVLEAKAQQCSNYEV